MGEPKKVEPAKVSESYNWGDFGSADKNGVNLSALSRQNLNTAQTGMSQYLNELINPSYNSESFRARQQILDQNNQQYANQLGANAIARGARGSATQNILNSIMANRNNDMRNAMTQEDARVRNILSTLSGTESNYFNQANTMANNILSRVSANAGAQNQANATNVENYNKWRNNLINTGVKIGSTVLGGGLGYLMTDQLPENTYGGAVDPSGMYGAFNPNDPYLIQGSGFVDY